MNKTLLIASCILLSLPGWCQKKKDNLIVIPKVDYKTIKTVLFRNGYSLINSDSVMLSTTGKTTGSVDIRLFFEITDSSVMISGLRKLNMQITFGMVTSDDGYETLLYQGSKGSPYRDAWEEMDRIAKLLSPSTTYSKR